MIIGLRGVTKFYDQFKALDNLSASISEGAIGLLGPNGAGKSTLLKALLGLVRLNSGEATVLGLDVRKDSRQIRQLVGYMPEDECYLAGVTAVQSVSYTGELAGLPPLTALRRAHEILDYVLIGEERYREVQTFSTGMKQKVKLAQALIHGPKLVFLDEPTSGLDPEARDKMIHLITQLSRRKGISVIISTHILHDVEESCDSVVIMGHGKLLVHDRIRNLQKSVDESYRVRISGEIAPFLKAVWGHGCKAERIGDSEARVWKDRTPVPDAVFAAARDLGTPVRHIQASQNSLEEIFLRAVSEKPHADL